MHRGLKFNPTFISATCYQDGNTLLHLKVLVVLWTCCFAKVLFARRIRLEQVKVNL